MRFRIRIRFSKFSSLIRPTNTTIKVLKILSELKTFHKWILISPCLISLARKRKLRKKEDLSSSSIIIVCRRQITPNKRSSPSITMKANLTVKPQLLSTRMCLIIRKKVRWSRLWVSSEMMKSEICRRNLSWLIMKLLCQIRKSNMKWK